MTTFTVEVESDYIRMGDSRRHRLNAYCTVIVRVSYGYGYTRGSGRIWVEIFGVGRVRVRVASSATGTGRVAKMVDPHTPNILPPAIFYFGKEILYCNISSTSVS